MAATNFSYPIFRSFKKSPNGGLEIIFPKHYNSRSQDLPKVYHDAGLFYWAKPDTWKKNFKGYNEKNSIVEIPNYRVQDIDTFDDWKKAEIIYKILKKNNN
jgi:N-acylneuraminate cytidylyltransferase